MKSPKGCFFKHAYAAYSRARDLDYNPFRAISDFNVLIHEIAARNPNVRLADLDAAFRETAAPRTPGFDLFLDYVHPSQTGNVVVARTVFENLVGERFPGEPAGPVEFTYEHSGYEDRKDTGMLNILLRLFREMHQYAGMVERARLMAEHGGSEYPLVKAILATLPDYFAIERRWALGEEIVPEEMEDIGRRMDELYEGQYRWTGFLHAARD